MRMKPGGAVMMEGCWIRSGEAGADAAEVRLFCVAHAGGGAAFFRPWRAPLLPRVEVCPARLPGRESRWREPARSSVQALLEPLCAAVLERADRPFALFGHSMGAVVAYEAARWLCAAGAPPLCLIVSARRAPHLPARIPPRAHLSAEALVQAVERLDGTPSEVLREPELLQWLLPTLRADFAVDETYAPAPGAPLPCPVSAWVGDADPEVDPGEMLGWEQVTRGAFTLRVFSGGHFYHRGAAPHVLDALRDAILPVPGP